VTRLPKLRAPTAALMIMVCIVACAVAFALPIVVAAAPTVSMQQVSEGLTCQCGCGLTVANCNHPNCEFSVPVREQIDRMLGRGMSGLQVIAYFRGKYGEKILSAPTTQGFNLLAWIMPFAAILAGGALVAFTVGRWRSNSPAPTPAPVSGADPSAGNFDPELRRRLERELRDRI
jgi:cytochrome c-type biogenesis protein CcmH